jgi:hypothetical protein
MTFSLTVIAGIAALAVSVSRIQARRSRKKSIQTLFTVGR